MYTHIHVRAHKHYTRCWGGQYYSVEILKEGKCLVGAQGRYVQPLKKKKVHGCVHLHVYKQRMQPTVTASYFWKVDLLALTKWLPHPHFVCSLGFVFAFLE